MWNARMYKLAVDAVDIAGKYREEGATNKEELYELFSQKLNYAAGTIKGWARPTSNGPEDPQKRNELAKLLGCSVDILCSERGVEEMDLWKFNANDDHKNISEVSKANIMEAYKLINDFLTCGEVEDVDAFDKLYQKLLVLSVAMPEEVWTPMELLLSDTIAPMSYDSYKVFEDCYSEDIGFFNDKGVFVTRNEDATLKHCRLFLSKLQEIENEVHQFGMHVIRPYVL